MCNRTRLGLGTRKFSGSWKQQVAITGLFFHQVKLERFYDIYIRLSELTELYSDVAGFAVGGYQ
jgi:hypothetical protein